MQDSRLQAVFAAVDAANAEDPRTTPVDGQPTPNELLYGRRMSTRLETLYPSASEELRIAARAQHIRRWTIARSDYPTGKAGYHAWRRDCRKMHAQTIGQIMAEHGYDPESIDQVGSLICKENIKEDSDSQRLQNVVGAVFVEHYMQAFAAGRSEDELINILRKTARKLDEEGLAAIGKLDLPAQLQSLVEKSLG